MGGRTLVDACTEDNKKVCSQRACMIEGQFVLSIYDLMVNFYQADDSAKHSNGFDPNKECKVTNPTNPGGPGGPGNGGGGGGGGGNPNPTPAPTKLCCAEYPFRFPYDPLKGQRQCCFDKTYDTRIMDCCSNNSVLPIGSC